MRYSRHVPSHASRCRLARRRRAALVASTLATAALVACSEASAPDAGLQGSEAPTSRIAATPATGDVVVRGVVFGVDSGQGRSPSESLSAIAGASVTVVHVFREGGGGGDSLTTPATLKTIATVTSASDGTFELDDVPSGYFILDVVPPAASGYRAGRAGTVSLAKSSSDRAIVYLYR